MSAADDILIKWYLGELGGHALFAQLEKVAAPDPASKWAALCRVEQRVASGLAAALLARQVGIPVPQNVESVARARCAKVAGKSWIETMQWFHAIAADALQRMQADADRLPTDLAEAGKLVVRHERALLAFAELELAGKGSQALEPIEAFLAD
jgi:hypothetical protein